MADLVTQMLDVTYKLANWENSDYTGEPFNVTFIGAGNVNFGSEEGPWNHSRRLEEKLGPRMRLVALIDPMVERCAAVLAKKRAAAWLEPAYRDTMIYRTVAEYAAAVSNAPEKTPRLIVVGCSPHARGSDQQGKDIEIQLMNLFPGVGLFIEKPISTAAIESAFHVAKILKAGGVPTSVGYMLRYLKACQLMKKIIKENGLTVMATIARYACAYQAIAKHEWWDKAIWGGPIIEQATHFCDLSRYFGGDVDLSTLHATTLEWDEPAGALAKVPVDESKVKPENRIPRVTSANWKYKNGGVGILTHLAVLQGTSYSCELEVYCDGYLFKLFDPYNRPVLHVRRPGSDDVEEYKFLNDDPFLTEISEFVDVIEHGKPVENLLSTFEDACKTYELTCAIRKAGEETHAKRTSK